MKLTDVCFFMEEYVVKILFILKFSGDKDPGKNCKNLVSFCESNSVIILRFLPGEVSFKQDKKILQQHEGQPGQVNNNQNMDPVDGQTDSVR